MHVLATAGHVDHGKSTLVTALTGIEPDRWEAERRRGLTIDLGYAWTTLPGGAQLAFVDVPGHRRFIGNMLAGLGPVPGVVFVVAADAGWSAQSSEHLRAVEALGIDRGLLVVTRADLADPGPTLADARARLADGPLAGVEALAVSAVTGAGLPQLRDALARVAATMPTPDPAARVRLWIDRSFAVSGAGTVVTGTLEAGTIRVGDALDLLSPRPQDPAARPRRVRVRGLQSLEQNRTQICGVARVAVNLRGATAGEIARGDCLLTPGAWRTTAVLDARVALADRPDAGDTPTPGAAEGGAVRSGAVAGGAVGRGPVTGGTVAGGTVGGGARDRTALAGLPSRVTLHVGTASPVVHVRPLGPVAVAGAAGDTEAGPALGAPGSVDRGTAAVRLTLPAGLPLVAGDRAILRDPGDASGEAIVGIVVADADPPALRRRGDGARRGAELAARADPGRLDLATEVARRGAMRVAQARELGLEVPEPSGDDGLERHGAWLVAASTWQAWAQDLRRIVTQRATDDPLDPAVPLEAARAACALPDRDLVAPLAQAAGLEITQGRVRLRGHRPDLGSAEAGLARLEARLADSPFTAPEAGELTDAGLGARQLAAAVATGRLLRLADSVYVLPSTPAQAMRILADLPQPFTVSQARQALATTRRVAIPLLEHLDARGWTRRLDAGHREVAR